MQHHSKKNSKNPLSQKFPSFVIESFQSLFQVVCHQLGYRGGEALVDLQFGTGSGRIHFDDVSCTGSEASILECASSEWSVHNCSHLEDAAVNCLN